MRLHRLRITAFGPFGTTQDVDFDALSAAGIFLLHGPTGAGKTSVLDAVCYALYGSVPGARQGSGQGMTLRSDHAPQGTRTEVCLELTVAGRRLEITRQPPWERPKKRGTGTTTEKAQSWLRESTPAGGWKDLSRSHQEIGEEIAQLLGMSKEQFCQVVLLPQGDFARFLRADAEARGKLLGRLFDTRRFAAVEQRLAEQRRTTEAEVKEGDAVLLADAHRMQQAAADGGRDTEIPLPALTPGDPGLATEVLTWAAVARTGARERLTIAQCALAAAESAQAAADRHLADAAELDRLQTRFTEARERAARLHAREAEQREREHRLERARKAEAVAPALGLREAAETEHRRAAREEARARAHLPETFEAAGAAGLAAAARKAAEELGGLASARRAEQRLADITAERAALDRQERADDDLSQDASAWLDGWEATRTALQDRVESAQEAATHAERLAGRLEPAQTRLDAARRRDRLAQDAAAAHERALTAREHATATHEHWLALKEQRLAGIAAELAAHLTDGEPCAVCGATEHPAPARKTAGHVDRGAEEEALAAHRAALESRTAAERVLGDVQASLAAATETARGGEALTGDEPTVEELAAHVEGLRREYAEARDRASALHAAREALAQAEREYDHRVAGQQEAARRAASRATLREALDREQDSLSAELAHARGTTGSVADRAAQLERQTALLTEAADAARAAADTAERLKAADARLADAAFRAGFDTPEAAAAALLDDARYRELQHRIDDWRHEEAAVRSVLAEPDTAAAAQRPPADLPGARAAADRKSVV